MKDWKTIPNIVVGLCMSFAACAQDGGVWWERDAALEARILAITNAEIETMIAAEMSRIDAGQAVLAARARALSLRLDAQMPQIEAEIRATLAALEGPTRPEIVHAIRLDVAREQGIAP
jgi:hypothetical protein